MPLQYKKGITLIELIVTMMLMSVVITIAGTAMYNAIQSIKVNEAIEKDQYNARMALLCITREIHRGVERVISTSGDTLEIEMITGERIKFEIDDDGYLIRNDPTNASPINFVSVKLESFTADVKDQTIEITIECPDGLSLSTKVSISRIPI